MAREPFWMKDPFLQAFMQSLENGTENEFMEAAVQRMSRENRARRKVRDNAEALEKLNRMRRARGMPELDYLGQSKR